MSVTENPEGTHYYENTPVPGQSSEQPAGVSPEIKMDPDRHFQGLRSLITDLEDPGARTELTALLRDFVEKFQVHTRIARRRQVAEGVSPEGKHQVTGVTPEVQKSVDEQDAAAQDSSDDTKPDYSNAQPVVADSRVNDASVFVNEQPQVVTPDQPTAAPTTYGVPGTPVTHP